MPLQGIREKMGTKPLKLGFLTKGFFNRGHQLFVAGVHAAVKTHDHFPAAVDQVFVEIPLG